MPKRKRVSTVSSLQDDDPDLESLNSTPAPKKVRWNRKDESDEDEGQNIEDESQLRHKIVLAAMCLHGRIGCAYYEPTTRILYVLEDTQEAPHFDLTRMLLEQLDPDIILTSSKSDELFKDTLGNYAENSSHIFQVRPFKEFTTTKGRDRLLSLSRLSHLAADDDTLPPSSDTDAASRPSNAYDFMQLRRKAPENPTVQRRNASIRLSNFASVDSSPLCLASVGALLDYMVRERALADLEDSGAGNLDIRDIELLSLNEVMQINSDSLISLQVFESESHASVHSDKTKEGLSLFGILNNTRTALGRSLLRIWLLRPSMSLSTIRSRHDAVDCFSLSENIITANTIHNHLKGLKNIPRIMAQMRSGRARLFDWQNLVKFTFHITMLRDALSDLHHASNVEIVKRVRPLFFTSTFAQLRQLIDVLDIPTFKEVGTLINDTIDWEESACNDRVCVRPNIDEGLDNRKHVYHGIDSVLSNVAEHISKAIPQSFATSLNVVYFPQLGFLICVPMLDEWRTEAGIQPLEGWTFQFYSEEHVYFKSSEMHDMDTHVGDLHSTIVDRELEIIQDLLEEIIKHDETIAKACDVCAELDCLLSFAEASRCYNLRRPEMAEENYTEIIQGRHPLYEQVVDTFVANDARLLGGAGEGAAAIWPDNLHKWHSVLLCTGANACGKSVYLKQIAIIQIMAQIGCFVPAESANLGIVDKSSKIQSAFMIDLAQVSLALRNCTVRSLVILDEFGKGTLSTDGAGLFCGVIRHFLNKGSNCPKVLIATHFHDVFVEDILNPDTIPITFCHMQVMFTSSSGTVVGHSADDSTSGLVSPSAPTAEDDMTGRPVVGPDEKITYLYRVAEGLCLNSYAVKCAEIFGIPRKVVERAQYVNRLFSVHELGQLLDEEMTEKERNDLQDAELVCRRFLAWDLKADEDVGDGVVKQKLADVLGR